MSGLSRRDFVLSSLGAMGLGSVSACASVASGGKRFEWTDQECSSLSHGGRSFEIIFRGNRVLRRLARAVPKTLDLKKVSERMQHTMKKAGGVGLAGPQVGLSLRIATLMLDYKTGQPKTIFVTNPVIVERSDDSMEGYEGCLSIPGSGGKVRRNRWIKIEYTDENGILIHTEAEGPNSVLWQHELDHLDGILYVDKLLGKLMPMDKVRELRKLQDIQRTKQDQDVSRYTEGSFWAASTA